MVKTDEVKEFSCEFRIPVGSFTEMTNAVCRFNSKEFLGYLPETVIMLSMNADRDNSLKHWSGRVRFKYVPINSMEYPTPRFAHYGVCDMHKLEPHITIIPEGES